MNNYNIIVSLYLFILCIGLSHGSPKKNKQEKFDVDYFLKKVIVSKNFDEIADKIANKAVEKIQEIQNVKKQIHRSKRLPAKNTAYRVSEADNKGPKSEDDNTTERNISEENKQFTTSSKKPINITEETVKIKVDMKAYKQKGINFLKDLSLKYNSFHKKKQPKEKEILTDIEGKESSKETTSEPNINNESDETTPNIIDPNKKSSFKSENKNEEDTKHDEPKKDLDRSENIEDHQLSKEDTDIRKPEIDKEKKDDLSVQSTDINKDENLNADTKDEVENNTPFYEYIQLTTKNKEDVKPKSKKRKQKQDKDNKTDNKDSTEKDADVKYNKNENSDRKAAEIFYRAEDTNKGKKLYAYEKSPSYEDYHEQRAKIQKEKKRKSNSYDDFLKLH